MKGPVGLGHLPQEIKQREGIGRSNFQNSKLFETSFGNAVGNAVTIGQEQEIFYELEKFKLKQKVQASAKQSLQKPKAGVELGIQSH